MKKLGKKVMVILIAMSMVTMAACANANADKPTTGDSDEEIVIGAIGPLTGSAAVYGTSVKNGISMAFDEINANGGVLGKELKLDFLDDKGDPQEAINAYNLLYSKEEATAILGSVTSTPSAAVAELAAEDGIPMLSATATALSVTEYGDNIFRVCFTDPFQGKALADFAAGDEIAAKKVAILYNTSDDYSSGIADAFEERARELSIEVVAKEGYAATDRDFKAQLNTIMAKEPDVLCVPDYYSTDSLIAAQAREIGLDIPILGADGWDGVTTTTDSSNFDSLNNVFFSNHYAMQDEAEKVSSFVNAYREEYNEDPTSFAALGYDAAMLLAEAIENAGSTDFEEITEQIAKIQFAGVTGDLRFDETGDPVKSITMIEIIDGEYVFHSKVEE